MFHMKHIFLRVKAYPKSVFIKHLTGIASVHLTNGSVSCETNKSVCQRKDLNKKCILNGNKKKQSLECRKVF